MPHQFQLYTNTVLKEIQDNIKSVCPTIFLANRPTASKNENKEFLVLNMPYSVRDRGAFQSTYFRIEIYVKSKSQGVPNMKRLEELTNSLLGMFPMTGKNKRFIARKPYLTLQGDDTLGYAVWYLQGSLIVNTIDTYECGVNSTISKISKLKKLR